jgi:hypothetical protein
VFIQLSDFYQLNKEFLLCKRYQHCIYNLIWGLKSPGSFLTRNWRKLTLGWRTYPYTSEEYTFILDLETQNAMNSFSATLPSLTSLFNLTSICFCKLSRAIFFFCPGQIREDMKDPPHAWPETEWWSLLSLIGTRTKENKLEMNTCLNNLGIKTNMFKKWNLKNIR